MKKNRVFVPVALKKQAEDFARRLLALDDDAMMAVRELASMMEERPKEERQGCAEAMAEIVYHTARDSEAFCLNCMGRVRHTVRRELEAGEFFCECER